MNNIYNQEYYQQYDIGNNKKVNYSDSVLLKDFFKNVAKEIVERYHPKSVLDAGCALGFLVKELRKLGVEAYGLDASEYAISHVEDEIKNYCRVCKLQEDFPADFPQQFDLITNIEVMEHIEKSDCKIAIKSLCSHTKRIIFSSTSLDSEEPTHINVNKIDYWAEIFAENNFFNCINEKPDYISTDAYCFEFSDNFSKFVSEYEKHILNCNKKNNNLIKENKKNIEEIYRINEIIKRQRNEIIDLEADLKNEKEEFKDLKNEFDEVFKAYSDVINSHYWHLTAPFRKITEKLKEILKKYKLTLYVCKFIKMFFKTGPKIAFLTACQKIGFIKPFDYTKITKQRRLREEQTKFNKDIKFSILVPLYNTPERFLKEMIDSVVSQTYKNWELCLADGSDANHSYVEKIVKNYIKTDKRIVYKRLEKNGGISENTNACIDMATGNYLALFDHDDVLHPSVLFENMKAICEHNADYIYTDEATFLGKNICKIITFHFKPDFAIDNLRANNYICHFSVFSKELQEKVGYFRHEYDGSQDHDMILRLTSKAEKVWHIRKLLYFWRSHPNSVASDINSKTYAIDAGKRAVAENIRKSGYECTVESSRVHPTIYRIKYNLKIHPLVSIIIPNMNHKHDLKRCIDSIMINSTYDNYEIIVIENNSTESEIFDYYSVLEKRNNIKVVYYKGKFNYSDINNYGAGFASGEYLILLNNDTEVITKEWIEEMLMYAQRPEVGIVGAKLYYPDDTVQHGGVIVGLGGVAGHSHCRIEHDDPGYMGKMFYSQEMSAVTAACLMIRKSIFDSINGFDCRFAVAFNDIDLCLRVREKNKLVVFNPYAELYHYESKSRGYEDTPEKKKRFGNEVELFHKKWDKKFLDYGDPYYNPNFSLDVNYQIDFQKLRKECRE